MGYPGLHELRHRSFGLNDEINVVIVDRGVATRIREDFARHLDLSDRVSLAADEEGELAELTAIYVNRGLTPAFAAQVAQELTVRDALGAHA